jgi:D-proline reductase (dithiol) PrdB
LTDTARTVDYIPRTRELYEPLPAYRWADRRDEPVPWAPLRKPLARCRVALGATGGVYAPGQAPFHFKDDTSTRVVSTSIEARELGVSHFGYPTVDAERDPNCVFPVDRLRELAADGTIGELAATAITCMGGIYSQRRVVEELVPAVLDWLLPLDVDLFYLVPA